MDRAAPIPSRTTVMKKALFGNLRDSVLTVLIAAAVAWLVYLFLDWLVLSAVAPWCLAESCLAASGACWPFLVEKHRLILFGTYPYDEQWRPLLASLLLLTAVGLSMWPRFHSIKIIYVWIIAAVGYFVLMHGGWLSLQYVQPEKWNGIPVLLMLAIFGILFSFPLGVLLALARFQDELPVVRAFATIYIEFVRGVPMIMVLFMGLFVLPLMMPASISLDPLLTTMVSLVFFHAAYIAESVRGGLQSVPTGQYEAADSQGFSYAQKIRLIILPQALKRALPGIMNTVLGAYKDTSLVVIIGIHDIMATAKMSFSEPSWQHYGLEAYFLVGIWYLTTCWCLSSYSRWLEMRET